MNQLSIVIPIYNEKENIKYLFNEFKQYKIYEIVDEVIYIDDCSTDGSLVELNLIKKKYSKVIVLRHLRNFGQSKCLHTGINHTKSSTIITIDGDGQNNPRDISKLIKLYFSNNEISLVGGIRHKRKDNLIKIFSSKIANNFRKLILNDDCNDTGCSLKIFDRKEFLKIPYFNGMHRFLPALFKGLGKKTKFINVDHRARIYGTSKYGTLKRLFYGIIDIIRVLIIIKKFNNIQNK